MFLFYYEQILLDSSNTNHSDLLKWDANGHCKTAMSYLMNTLNGQKFHIKSIEWST